MRILGAIASSICLVVAAGPALAVDGVIEINQVKALAGGVTPSDTMGFPITIGTSGSFILTGDLDLSAAPTPQNATAIRIAADDVTIDLNGFAIRGTTVCTGDPVTCTPTGSGYGVDAHTSSPVNTTIKNGTIRGVGNIGIVGRLQVHVSSVRVLHNGGGGVWVTEGGNVTGSHAFRNGYDGIFVGDAGTVSESTAYENNHDGIFGDPASRLAGNVAYRNGGTGIRAADSSTVIQNTSYNNVEDGINVGVGSTVSANTVTSNVSDGIETGSGCTVRDNTARFNGFGLNLGSGTGYGGNTMEANFSDAVIGSGVQVGPNLCDGAPCP